MALPFVHAPHYAAEDIIAAPSNEEALAWLARPADWPSGRLVLWGEEGCGKTHLLHAWAARNGGKVWSVPLLRGLPEAPGHGLALDDADAVGDPPALLHLLNAAAEARRPVLLAARVPPAQWAPILPDLESRLRAAASVEVRPPDEALLRALLGRLLSDRQLTAPPGFGEWLLTRLPRTPAALREAVARLDRAALAARGSVSRSLALAVLADMAGAEDDDMMKRGGASSRCPPHLL